MADQTRYQVVSACVIVPIQEDTGTVMHTLYRGAVFSADPTNYKVAHNADTGYIVALATDAASTDAADTPPAAAEPTVDEGDPEDAKAEAKAPRGRPSADEKAKLVDQAVAAGMSKIEAEKASVADLRSALAK